MMLRVMREKANWILDSKFKHMGLLSTAHFFRCLVFIAYWDDDHSIIYRAMSDASRPFSLPRLTDKRSIAIAIIMCASSLCSQAKAFLISSSSRFVATRPSTSSVLLTGSRQKKSSKQKKESCGTRTLEWETFEFGDSPKWDERFKSRPVVANTEDELAKIHTEDAIEDGKNAKTINAKTRAWHNDSLTPGLVDRATKVLKPYVTQERIDRIKAVLDRRTGSIRFLFENP